MSSTVIVISGPTAAGKTSLSLELARQFDGEIISADSRQVYRGFDIGTAKANAAEQAVAPHHLLDVVDANDPFDVARFVELARAAIAQIVRRGRVPLLVGGSGLYLRALLGGLAPIAGRDDAVRAQLEAERQRFGIGALHLRLAQVDPAAAARIPNSDVVRIIRALEVFQLSGVPLSEHQRRHAFLDRPYRSLWFVVDHDRNFLWQRIEQRTKRMFAEGLLEEASALRSRFGPIALLDTLGYQEALAHLDGGLSLTDAVEKTIVRTRRYAKRQRTWLRREPVDHWLLAPSSQQVIDLVGDFASTTMAT